MIVVMVVARSVVLAVLVRHVVMCKNCDSGGGMGSWNG